MNFDEWLKYYIMDNKINPTEIIYEGLYEGRFRKMNILDIAFETSNRPQRQKEMRQQLSRKSFVGEDIKECLREMIISMEEFNVKQSRAAALSQNTSSTHRK